MIDLNKIISYVNENAKRCFGESIPFCYVADKQAWFRNEFPYILRIGDNEKIKFSVFIELHQVEMSNTVLFGEIGFILDDLEHITAAETIISNLFNIYIENERVIFRYKYRNEFNKTDNPAGFIVFNGHVYEIIDQCFADIYENINNGSYIKLFKSLFFPVIINHKDIMRLINTYTDKEITINKGMQYAINGNVIELSHSLAGDKFNIDATVIGHNGNYYNTIVSFTQTQIINHQCNCLAHQEYNGLCKHLVAVMFKFSDTL